MKVGDKVVYLLDTDLYYSKDIQGLNLKGKIGKITHINPQALNGLFYLLEFYISEKKGYIRFGAYKEEFKSLNNLILKKFIKG